MATPGDLIRTIAAVTGIPEATVVVYDRSLLDAGLRTKGGRGRSAAKMTALDCARDLLAVMGGVPAHAAEFVSEYGQLKTGYDPMGEQASHLLGIDFPHTLEEAVAALIGKFADKSINEIISDYKSTVGLLGKASGANEKYIILTVNMPIKYASLSFSFRKPTDSSENMEIDFIYHEEGNVLSSLSCDLKTKRTVSGKTFRILGDILSN